ncbi:MAG: DUF3788 family protein [Bacteroidota bacterium]
MNVIDRPFADRKVMPSSASLESALGKMYLHYNELILIVSKFKATWNYTPSGGWMQKIADSKKALLYVIPERKSFIISLTIRETERELLLKDTTILSLQEELYSAKKFSEGYHLKMGVSNKKQFAVAILFINALIKLRCIDK